MSDHALVVGCDDYPGLRHGNLRGAVRDALAVRDWLLLPTGGGLDRRDLTLLVSCAGEGAQAAPGEADGPASRRELSRAVRRLVEGPGGGRLYVYFAGHGCRTNPVDPLLSRDAILLTDFDPDDAPAGSVGVTALRSQLEMAPFGEIILIVDACRDLPFGNAFTVGPFGFHLPPRAGGQGGAARVYVLQATAPGETAAGAESGGEFRGVVSRALTDGLRGAGAAKVFDDTDRTGRPYQVRWTTLCGYLESSVRGQQPRYYGERDLVLATFPDGSFGPVRLDVEVEQGAATDADLAQLDVKIAWPVADDAAEDGEQRRPGPAPVTVDVPPRRHRVVARAGATSAKTSVDVYADDSVRLILKEPPRPVRGTYGPGARRSGVDILSDDPASVLQLRDGSGAVRAAGVAWLGADLAAGSYTAIAIGPDGTQTRQPADVFPEERTSVMLTGTPAGGWPARRGPLAWASPAAWVAAADPGTWPAAARDAGLVVAAVEADQPAGPGTLTPVRSRPGNRAMLVYAHLVPASPPRTVIDIHGVRLEAPSLPGVVTSIVVSGGDTPNTSVGLFDLGLLDRPEAMVMLDRAQGLLGAGRPESAEILLTQVRRASRVAEVLLEGIRSAAPPQELARGRPDAHLLLEGTPWAVLVSPG